MITVRQERGPAVTVVLPSTRSFIELRHNASHAARGGDPIEWRRRVGSKNNHPVAIPGSAATIGRVTERERRSARSLDFFELPIREESQ